MHRDTLNAVTLTVDLLNEKISPGERNVYQIWIFSRFFSPLGRIKDM